MGCRAVTRRGPQHQSMCIHKISKFRRNLENQHRGPIINRAHAPTKVKSCAKYQQDPLNIVGCRAVTRLGRTDGQTDRQTALGTAIPYGPFGPRVTRRELF